MMALWRPALEGAAMVVHPAGLAAESKSKFSNFRSYKLLYRYFCGHGSFEWDNVTRTWGQRCTWWLRANWSIMALGRGRRTTPTASTTTHRRKPSCARLLFFRFSFRCS